MLSYYAKYASCIIHGGIAQKLGEYSYIENKETAQQGRRQAIFMYFPADDC